MTTVLAIGDPHIQLCNLPEVDILIARLVQLINSKDPDFVVLLGDILHDHERLHTIPLNKAYEMISTLSKLKPLYILVGNHDLINNSQFLSENHWLNGLKHWNNVHIVDKVIDVHIHNEKFILCPYVPNGRFKEALATCETNYETSSCIFAHQEFVGCKMGAIVSVDGDQWGLDDPYVVSGHIHSKQTPQENIYYPGSALQIAFGESEKNIVALLKFDNIDHELEEVDLNLPRKKTLYLDVDDLETYILPNNTCEDKIRLVCSGDQTRFNTFKKTDKYKSILEHSALKITYKAKKEKKPKIDVQSIYEEGNDLAQIESNNFNDILSTIVLNEKNPYLSSAYEKIINDKNIKPEEYLFF